MLFYLESGNHNLDYSTKQNECSQNISLCISNFKLNFPLEFTINSLVIQTIECDFLEQNHKGEYEN